MNFLLDIIKTSRDNPFGEKMAFGASTFFIGIAAVFAVLIIIWICLIGLKFLLHDIPAQRKSEKEAKPQVVAPAPVVAAPVKNNDEEIVAVIAAAIAMAESEESGLKFRVVSFKRK